MKIILLIFQIFLVIVTLFPESLFYLSIFVQCDFVLIARKLKEKKTSRWTTKSGGFSVSFSRKVFCFPRKRPVVADRTPPPSALGEGK